MEEEKDTWSPFAGTSPEPTRRSNALTPPELGSSKNSEMGNLEEMGEEEEGGGGSEKMNAEKVVEMSDRDKDLLGIVEDAEQVANMLLLHRCVE